MASNVQDKLGLDVTNHAPDVQLLMFLYDIASTGNFALEMRHLFRCPDMLTGKIRVRSHKNVKAHVAPASSRDTEA